MSSVMQRINCITQPRGGYVSPYEFEVIDLKDDAVLNDKENVSPATVGIVVDYMSRYMLSPTVKNKKSAFEVSLIGAEIATEIDYESAEDIAKELLCNIKGLDDNSIINACQLVSFDVYCRNPAAAINSDPYDEINPNKDTINNIRTLIKRSLKFFEEYGPITKDGFTFEPVIENDQLYDKVIQTNTGSYGGYSATVNCGDGDFLTKDTLWDFKVSKYNPTSKHTLQLLMYWIMGQHSDQKIYKGINKLGIFNPRLNKVYLLDINKVSDSTIKIVEKEVICYN